MKRIAATAIILVQLWMLAPVCCCWFKATANASVGDCCCSQGDDGTQKQTPAGKDRDCRCSENKIQLPPQVVSTADLASRRLAFDQLLLVSTQFAEAVVAEPSGLREFNEWPPPLAVADRLATLHRLNL